MIVSFYGKDFKGLQNNAALVVDNASYSLVRRGVDFDDLKCVCEAFTENIQPTFLIVKNDKGQYVYAALAGIPQLTKENKTEITASDIKTMLKSDIVFNLGQKWDDVNDFLTAVFSAWNKQVNKNSFTCELKIKDNVGTVAFEKAPQNFYEGDGMDIVCASPCASQCERSVPYVDRSRAAGRSHPPSTGRECGI